MYSFTFDTITRDENQDFLYDIFRQTIIEKPLDLYYNFVKDDEECRLDKVMMRLYSSSYNLEEFMVLNDIVNPWSVQSGNIIYYAQGLQSLREIERDDTVADNVANPKKKKETRIDPTRQKGVPPTIKPVDFQQILVDKKNKTIKLNTKLS
ncbi:MAG: hypothetical protein HPY57_14465 [Ignavibacteria bacterium]|nr:hypothetical protein [Ignavibacteria bacterium]